MRHGRSSRPAVMGVLVAILASLVIVATPTAHSANPAPLAPPLVATKGILHLAADFSAAPNQFIQNGNRRGLNPDLCGAIGKQLNVKIEWTNLAFDGLIPGLLAKRFDALCTSVFITAAREQVMYMVPYVRWGDSLAIPSNNPHHISCPHNNYSACFTQLAGLTIATTAGGAEEAQLKLENTALQKAGKATITINAFDTNTQAYQALLGGQADGVYVNDPQIHFFEKQHPGRFKTAFAGFSPLQLSLTTRKDDLPLAKALQRALKQLKKSGTYQRILRKWGVLPASTFAINPPAQ